MAIKKELALAIGRLKLAKFNKRAVTNSLTSPVELITYLSCAGIFKYALHLCSVFELPYESVFEIFTQQCLHLQDDEDPEAWNWLTENDLYGKYILIKAAIYLSRTLVIVISISHFDRFGYYRKFTSGCCVAVVTNVFIPI